MSGHRESTSLIHRLILNPPVEEGTEEIDEDPTPCKEALCSPCGAEHCAVTQVTIVNCSRTNLI